MALSNLSGWNEEKGTTPTAACGSACGAADKPEEKPAACGSACGAADKPAEAPAACGAADKPEENPPLAVLPAVLGINNPIPVPQLFPAGSSRRGFLKYNSVKPI